MRGSFQDMSDEPVPSIPRPANQETGGPVLQLSRFLPYQLNHLAEAVSHSFSKIYADQYGIGIPEWRVLATLGEYRAMTARDIGQATSMHKTKVSRAVAALEKRGLIVRIKNPDDQREQMLELSAKGSTMYEDIVPQALAYSAELQASLSAEQQALLDEIFTRLHKAACRHHVD